MGELLVYSASAGSGKTHSIAGQYILMLFAKPGAWRNILAVTFTNKACDEMKSRIIDELNSIINNLPGNRTNEIATATGLSNQMVVNRAKEIFTGMLHDYSFFSVSTIDSFFQKILRNFTRETGIQYNYELELDTDNVINMAVDELLEKSNSDPILKKNIIILVEQKMESLAKWDFRSDLKNFLKEVIQSDYRSYEKSYTTFFSEPKNLVELNKKLNSIQQTFSKSVDDFCIRLQSLMTNHGLSIEDFSGGNRSSVIKRLLKSNLQIKNNEVVEIEKLFNNFDDREKWFSKANVKANDNLLNIADEFIVVATEMFHHFENEYPRFVTAILIKKHIGYAALINDGLKAIHDYLGREDKFLISEVPVFLSEIAQQNSSSFIYEKTGTFYENYLIDEFQDTSISQWNSFYPLLSESLASAGEKDVNVLVGDVKQSIYAWRGGDWRLLAYKVQESFINYFKSINLDQNWRSGKTIVNFNNEFFTLASTILAENIRNSFPPHLSPITADLITSAIYNNISQSVKKDFDSEVKIIVFEKADNKTQELDSKSRIIENLIRQIEELQLNNHQAGEIMILVRSNAEGSQIAKHIIRHSQSDAAKKGVVYDVISSDALFISANKAVKLIIACFKYLNNLNDSLAFTEAAYIYYIQNILSDNQEIDLSREDFTVYFSGKIDYLKEIFHHKLLHEITNIIIEELALNKNTTNIPFLNSFRDIVHEFSLKNPSEIGVFLEYWEETGVKQNLKIPEKQNAINIISIHKSKGLAADFVFVPFCDWVLSKSGDLIWVSATDEPFNTLPVWPVNFDAKLEKSAFAEDYYLTKFKNYVESFNMMYVAFTRARKGLYISFTNTPDVPRNQISTIVNTALADTTFINNIAANVKTSEELKYTEYSIGRPPSTSAKTDQASYIETYPVHIPDKSIKIKSFFERDKVDVNSESSIHKGIVFHKVFENINTTKDIESAINKMIAGGVVRKSDLDYYTQEVNKLCSLPLVKDWFTDKYKILNESEIITDEGRIKRPDRIMIDSDRIIIVDYKFGQNEKSEYISQTREYAGLLKKLGYKNIEIYLWFVLSGFLLKVNPDNGQAEKISVE